MSKEGRSSTERIFDEKMEGLFTTEELAESYGLHPTNMLWICVAAKMRALRGAKYLQPPNLQPPNPATYSATRGKLWSKAEFDEWFGEDFLIQLHMVPPINPS